MERQEQTEVLADLASDEAATVAILKQELQRKYWYREKWYQYTRVHARILGGILVFAGIVFPYANHVVGLALSAFGLVFILFPFACRRERDRIGRLLEKVSPSDGAPGFNPPKGEGETKQETKAKETDPDYWHQTLDRSRRRH
jgi:hypothetical protein